MPTTVSSISAANGFLSDLGQGSKVHRVHATGQQWLTILSKYFAVNKHKYFGKKITTHQI